MGHLRSGKSDLAGLIPLIDRLNQYPVGLADSPTLREILALLFSPEEADLAAQFPLHEATLEELSETTGKSTGKLIPLLESMADKGLVTDLSYKGQTYYLLMPGVIGFFEFTFMKNRTDIPLDQVAKLMSAYFRENTENGQAREFFGSQTQLTRSLAYDSAIPTSSEIVSYQSARKIIAEAGGGAASMCYCRHQREHEGKTCKKGAPVEGICLTIGKGAEFLVRRGFAEQKTTEELLAILEKAEKLNLTHITDNVRFKPSFICNCCGCCCHIMEGVKIGYLEGIHKTPYRAVVDVEKCDYCGDCFTACNVGALGLDKSHPAPGRRVTRANAEKCLGCGACITACDREALSLITRKSYILPPKTKRSMFARIAWEKGRLGPLMKDRVRHNLKSALKLRK